MNKQPRNWQFIDDQGTFRLEDPHHTSYLYFPLVNEDGMMSAITPTLNGDIKINQNAFLTLPVSMEDLHNTRSARNFWVTMDGKDPWSATGNSALQVSGNFAADASERASLEAGFLWHKITRTSDDLGLRAVVTNYVPASHDPVELMQVTVTNLAQSPVRLIPTAAIPIYGRSADALRDHRQVTSLLHRIRCHPYGVLVEPTLTFDERGHRPNHLTYAVLGACGNGDAPEGFFPRVETFIGEGGTLDWPEAIIKSRTPEARAGQTYAGTEAMGGLRFPQVVLQPGESASYVLVMAILEPGNDPQTLVARYACTPAFDNWLQRTRKHWQKKLEPFRVLTGEPRFDLWMRWVSLQPTLRRLYGNSFLPAHDYGRGGRGWRDLWQDILALLLTESGDVGELLYGNFAGIRIDGSNATIIGSKPGEFIADRNNIPRVWMDHGAWPLLTTCLYIDQTGDLDFLLRQQTYFKDHLAFRSRKIDPAWEPGQGTLLHTTAGEPYRSTILEHLLVQHLIPFFNVGEHNNILLEGADWNDGMDMACDRGESVAFSALYAGNLRQLSELVLALESKGVRQLKLATEMLPLLDTLTSPVDYGSVSDKHDLLDAYFESCLHHLSGEKVAVSAIDLAGDLAVKASWLSDHIRRNEWVKNREGYGWFNGYYDNDGQRLEGDHPNGARMTLTGQVFTLMGGVATAEQAKEIVRTAERYLQDPTVGGYRLNTNFGELKLNLGRAFGFAYGHKENGAMFSHMAVMYANALYQRGLVRAGHQVLQDIYRHCQDFQNSRMYPGIPEYINPDGRGMYTWLTGSASWYLLTLVTEVFGVRGVGGDLALQPRLLADQFDPAGEAALTTLFAGKPVQVRYHNPAHLDYGEYGIGGIWLDGQPLELPVEGARALIPRAIFLQGDQPELRIDIHLEKVG